MQLSSHHPSNNEQTVYLVNFHLEDESETFGSQTQRNVPDGGGHDVVVNDDDDDNDDEDMK